MSSSGTELKIKETPPLPSSMPVPIIPRQVDLDDLIGFNYTRLYSQQEVKRIKEALKTKPDGYYSKKHPALKASVGANRPYGLRAWSILKINRNYYAAYYGAKYRKSLGRGSYAKTILFQNIDTGEWSVGKKSERRSLKVSGLPPEKLMQREANILNLLGRLSAYKPHSRNKPTPGEEKSIPPSKDFSRSFLVQIKKTSKKVEIPLILTDYYEGMNLFDFIKIRRLTYKQLLTIFINMTAAVSDIIKKKRILHRDIKPDNFIINPITLQVTLIDFNLSKTLGHQQHNVTDSYHGSPKFFRAKEVSDLKTGLSPKQTDVKPAKETKHSKKYLYSEETEALSMLATFREIIDTQTTNSDTGHAFYNYTNRLNELFKDTYLRGEFANCKQKKSGKSNETKEEKFMSFDMISGALNHVKRALRKRKLKKKQASKPIPPSKEKNIFPEVSYLRAADYPKIIQNLENLTLLQKMREVILLDEKTDEKSQRSHSLIIKSLKDKKVKIQYQVHLKPRSLRKIIQLNQEGKITFAANKTTLASTSTQPFASFKPTPLPHKERETKPYEPAPTQLMLDDEKTTISTLPAENQPAPTALENDSLLLGEPLDNKDSKAPSPHQQKAPPPIRTLISGREWRRVKSLIFSEINRLEHQYQLNSTIHPNARQKIAEKRVNNLFRFLEKTPYGYQGAFMTLPMLIKRLRSLRKTMQPTRWISRLFCQQSTGEKQITLLIDYLKKQHKKTLSVNKKTVSYTLKDGQPYKLVPYNNTK